MSKILVFIESANGKLKRSSQELLSAAKASGNAVVALGCGAAVKSLAAEVGQFGASELHVLTDSTYDQYNSDAFAFGVTEVIKKSGATIILASASSLGKDLFPKVAAKLNSGIASDCIELKISGESVIAKKPLYAGKCFAQIEFQNSPYKIVLMRANQLPISSTGGASAQVIEHSDKKADLLTLIKEVVKGTSEKLDLTEANIIVSGGRGLKEAANFKLLNDLANVLGATVGASRAVVDAGWVSHDMQVGQTGKTVAPSLYIAVGVSGAIQHLAGMSGSKVIVAINNDANAPIFQKATYGIVGDLFDVVPKLTEEFKKALHH